MKNTQKGFIVPLLIAIIAVLAIGGGIYVFEQSKPQQTEQQPVADNQTVSTSSDKVVGSISSTLTDNDILKAIYTISANFNGTKTAPKEIVFPTHTANNTALTGTVWIYPSGKVTYSEPVSFLEAFWIYKYEYTDSTRTEAKVYVGGSFGASAKDDRVFVVDKINGKVITKEITSQPVKTSQNNTAQTVTWKTYTNAQYGFSFQYPTSFGDLTTLKDNSLALGQNGNAQAVVYMPKVFLNNATGQSRTFSDLMNDYNVKGYTKTNVVVGGIQSVGVSSSQIGSIVFVPLANNQILEIDGSLSDPLFNQMLSTFKFTVSSSTGSKTYTNNQYGFSIEYPQDWTVSSKPLSFVDSLDISKTFGVGSQGYTCSSAINLISTSVFDQNAYSYNSANISGWQATTPTINSHPIVAWTNSTNFPGTFAYYVKNANSQYSYGINDSTKTLGVYNQSTGVWTTLSQNIYVKACADVFSQMISTLKFTN